ncbi:hypothetical protein BC834DRAFT_1041825 [Gloeopeniophorella convolvens]|nr:hypothetical protein BC834DRAFT_1041825 [Gloeopeniophorella convolvens]
MVSPSRLLSLPVELLAHTILLLHETPRDVLACQLTCRKLCYIVGSSAMLQYVLLARRAGVVDFLLPGMSAFERTRALERWERPWLFPDLRQPAYSMPQPWADEPPVLNRAPQKPNYFIQRGRLVSVVSYSPFKYAVLDLRMPTSSLNNSWSLVTIPAFHDDEEYNSEDFFQGYEFVFDLDLLVLVHLEYGYDGDSGSRCKVEIKLFNISEGMPHTSALLHTINIFAPADGDRVTVKTAMLCDCIYVHVAGYPAYEPLMHVVEWKTGTVSKPSNTGCEALVSPNFEVLTEDIFLFYHLDSNTLHIASSPAGQAHVHSFCYLFLPAIRRDSYLSSVDSDSEPSSWFLPSKTPVSDSYRTPQRIHFHSLPDNRIISFGARYYDRPAFRVLIPRKKLLAFMTLDTGHRSREPQVPWTLWGPQSAHVVLMDSLSFEKVVGERWFFEDAQGIAVRDFHPSRVREAAAWFGSVSSIQENGCTIKVVSEPVTVASRGETLAKDVVSALPYVETRFPISSKDCQGTVGIAVDDVRIVHVVDKVIGGATQRWLHVYFFV